MRQFLTGATSGAAFAFYATLASLLGLVLVAIAAGTNTHDWTHYAYAGVIELAAVPFALLSLRDR
jgi:hypothetical protein